ncbi:MAG TPA: membrane dipeptidase [Pirellulaceae bacterium]|nr:membrane dipeptidase [Pirellulaceae bacterium]
MLIFDGHLDLSMCAIHWNRDLTRPLEEVRRREQHQTDKPDRGRGVLTFPEMRRGRIGLCIATQIGHSVSATSPVQGWHSPEIAWAQTQGQLAWYRAMEEAGQMKQIVDRAGLLAHVALWQQATDEQIMSLPIGYILSLEGADSMLTPEYVERAYAYGLRAIGPAHYGPGRYSPGTGAEGPLEPRGRELLKQMRSLGMCLDLTHLTDEAFWEALKIFDGPVWASHQNCRALVPHQRQHSDEQIKAVIERDGIIGSAFDAWMMVPNWVRGQTTPEQTGVRIETIVDHIDHICQIAGSARHCAIGSDLDGGYGKEQTALDLETIADLQKLNEILARRGYSPEDITGIMHGNWIRVLSNALGA